jgi:aminoglycoside phosphotransferase (APT) family kinase protein
MKFQPIDRAPDAVQQPLDEAQLDAVCRRAFGEDTKLVSAVELGLGSYNNTYRLTLAGHDQPVILRVAPASAERFSSELNFMRTEYASMPWLAVIAPLLPRVLAADWSHDVIDRDWMIQTLLDGVPAPDGLAIYPRPMWAGFFRQLGAIAKAVHSVRGPHFGAIVGPGYETWSEAFVASLEDIVTDLDSVGLDAADLRRAIEHAITQHTALDEIDQPRLLSGDLWTVNVMVAEGAPEPTITGVLDFDRTLWGDPAADWPIRLALKKPGTEREAFWDPDGYGPLDRTPASTWRSLIYEVRHLGAVRLESFRSENRDAIAQTYADVAATLQDLDRAPDRI